MDSIDPTSSNGDFSLQIAGISYPQKPLSSSNNKSGIMNELRRSMGSIFGSNVSMSINAYEFSRSDQTICTYDKPGKFWVGINLQNLQLDLKHFLLVFQLKTVQLLQLSIQILQLLKLLMLC